MIIRGTASQFLRFAAVGVISNAVLYAAYLLLTEAGIAQKVAMTLLYMVGVTQTFLFNKGWTFSFSASNARPFIRYCTAYAVGYLLNLTVLMVFVDRLGYPHQVVQGLAVLGVAVILFLLHKFWVFRPSSASSPSHQRS